MGDAIREVTAVNHFQMFFDKLYSLYSRSPKNKIQLSECATDVDEQLRKIGRIFGVRWVASSFRTVSAVWDNFQALCCHFERASQDDQRDGKERSMFLGLLNRIRSPEFLIDLGVMYDALYELSSLSELLQNRSTSLVQADKYMRRTIRVLQSMKEKSGTHSLEAKSAAIQLKFKTIKLAANKKLVTINEKQFLTSLINNMSFRLFCTRSSNEKQKADPTSRNAYADLLKQFSVLDKETWPVELNPGYGEDEVKDMCKRFELPQAQIINAFRDFVDNIGRREPADLKPLVNCTQVIPCSTAECERGFSHMNIIVSDTRSNLTIPHVSSLMFIKLHGPPISMWRPMFYAQTWLRNHRSATDTKTRIVPLNSTLAEADSNPLWKLF